EAGDNVRFLPAAVIEGKLSTKFFQPVTGELGERTADRGGSRLTQRFEEVILPWAPIDRYVEALRDDEQLVAGEVSKDLLMRGHEGGPWKRGSSKSVVVAMVESCLHVGRRAQRRGAPVRPSAPV